MSSGPASHDPVRRRPALLIALALCFAAAVLGPLAAIAAAGSKPIDSGGAGLITTTSGGAGPPVGTTTAVLTTPATGTGTTTTCTTPVIGTVTTTGAAPAPSPSSSTTTAPAPTPTGGCAVEPPSTIPAPRGSALTRRGMWIWELPATAGGSIANVIAEAKQYGIGTLYVKSGDGTTMWSQFNPTLVDELHAAGLHVCAWQYVYGDSPVLEAEVGAQAVHDGADCLVIDAESQYQTRYVQAQQYMGALRVRIGSSFPVALAGFPYVDYHPTFPYSVFLGRNGAQYNLPQMYWQDIGTTVDAVYAHTFAFNELYQRPIYPLGQIFNSPANSAVRRFRAVGMSYRAKGLSWWDWQSAGSSQFSAIAVPTGPIKGYSPDTTVASLAKGAVGDLVVLAQEHLWNTHERVTIDGGFGAATEAAIGAFQALHGLPATGVIDPATWLDLLKVPVPKIAWTAKGHSVIARVSG